MSKDIHENAQQIRSLGVLEFSNEGILRLMSIRITVDDN